jgi:hypothetical protein
MKQQSAGRHVESGVKHLLLINGLFIDLYKPWTFEAYVKIADVWLRDQKSKVRVNNSL